MYTKKSDIEPEVPDLLFFHIHLDADTGVFVIVHWQVSDNGGDA